jgi:2-dehydropantoate 2-reductase
MLQDIEGGKPTEIDAICGAVVKAAEGCGQPAPVNWTMWKLIHSIENHGGFISHAGIITAEK